MKKPILIAVGSALATAALLRADAALAEGTADPSMVVSLVRTADLDLASADGRRALDRRLAAAARDVCGQASDADLAGRNDVRACRVDVLARARADSTILLAAARNPVIAVTASR